MSRKNTIIIIVLVIGLAIGALFGFYYYLNSSKTGDTTQTSTSKPGGFFGLFGSSNNSTDTPPSNDASQNTGVSTATTSTGIVVIPRLRHINQIPTAGTDFVIQNIYATTTVDVSTSTAIKKITPKIIGTQEVIRWIDRATGNIFDASTSSLDIKRISNTTVPKVYEAFLTNGGTSVILRGLFGDSDVIQTQYGALQAASATATEQMLKLNSLVTNITTIALSPAKDQIFYMLPASTSGTISKTDGTSKVTIYDSPFTEWLASWPNASGIILTTKPSGQANGFAYLLNPKTKSVTKIIGDTVGLTTLASPDLSRILIGSSPQNTLSLDVMSMKDKSTRNLSLKTLPEKCVWSKVDGDILYCAVPQSLSFGTYPDSWYQGITSFSDSLWKLNLKTGQSTLILRPSDYTNAPLDMTDLTLSSKEDYITFIDKNDLSLWGYNLSPIVAKTPVVTATSTATTTAR